MKRMTCCLSIAALCLGIFAPIADAGCGGRSGGLFNRGGGSCGQASVQSYSYQESYSSGVGGGGLFTKAKARKAARQNFALLPSTATYSQVSYSSYATPVYAAPNCANGQCFAPVQATIPVPVATPPPPPKGTPQTAIEPETTLKYAEADYKLWEDPPPVKLAGSMLAEVTLHPGESVLVPEGTSLAINTVPDSNRLY